MDQPALMENKAAIQVRAIFISDIHLGTSLSRSDRLLSFLQTFEAPLIYLVGDVVDFWRIRRGARWRPSQTGVLQELLARSNRGTHIVYIPGNHDGEMRAFAGLKLGQIEVRLRALHDGADGRRYLVIHGDEFDVVMRKAKWLAVLGDIAYDLAMALNAVLNAFRRAVGLPYWSLSAYLKHAVKRAVNSIGSFEKSLTAEARRENAQGVICGHIHHAATLDIDGIRYINTGDWVESCTGVVEHFDGRMELVRWNNMAGIETSKASALA